MEDRKHLRLWISDIPFFRLLDQDEATELAAALKSVHFEQGQTIFSAGDNGDALYIVQQGLVELFIRDYTGEKILLREAASGDFFGELALLDEGPRTASAIVTEACDCYVLRRADLLVFLRKKPDAAIDMLAALSKQIRTTDTLLRGRVSRNANAEINEELSTGQKIANTIADFSGSIPFLFINVAIFFVWIVWNVGLVPGLEIFDPYPFGFLTMAVSLEAICLSIFVLLAQNLQAAKDSIHSNIEYEVNLKAELEIAYLHEKVDRFQEEMLTLLRRH